MALFDNIIQPAQFQQPIPFQQLETGLRAQESNTTSGIRQIQGELDNLYNLATLPGADTKVKNDVMNNVQQQLQGISVGDLSNPQNISKLHSLISSATQNPDFQNVIQRGATFQQMKAEKDKAEAAGKEYINPGYDDAIDFAQNYSGKGVYVKNKSFTSDGYIAPDMLKLMAEAEKLVPEESRVTQNSRGEWITETYKDPKKLQTFIDYSIKNTPNTQKLFDYKFDKEHQSVNWDNHAKDVVAQDLNSTNLLIDAAKQRLAHANDRDKPALRAHLDDLLATGNKLTGIYNSNATGAAIKNYYKDQAYQKQINDFVQASQYAKYGEPNLDEYTKIGMEHANRMTEELHTKLSGLYPYLSIEDQSKFQSGNYKGIDFNSAQTKADQAVLTRDVEKAKQIATVRADAKLRSNKLGNPSIKGTEIFEINGVQQNKSQWDAVLSSITDNNKTTDNKSVLALIKEQPEKFNISQEELNKLSPDDLIVDKKTGEIKLDNIWPVPNKVIGTQSDLKSAFYGSVLGGNNNTTIPTSNSFQHSAILNGDTIYSNDGRNWYTKEGKTVQ